MRKPWKKKSKIITFIILAIVIFFLGYYMGNMNETTIIYRNETRTTGTINYVPYVPAGFDRSDMFFTSILVPAVNEEGNGITTVLIVQIMPGEGRILANIDKMLFWTDTQNSIRTSSRIASNITGINLSKYDIIYTIETNSTSVEGPSAGAAVTIATIAALHNRKIDIAVMITGSINHDGTIGAVSQILAKARAAKDMGARLLLVPAGQSHEIIYETIKHCEQTGPAQICSTDQVPRSINISSEVGIEIKEVSDINEALRYFFNE
jgi:uncharacterized protein